MTGNHTHNHNHSGLIGRMGWAFALTLITFFAELIGGFLSNSLALLSDAGHLFADVFAIGLSLTAIYISRLPATDKRTYGYHRAEVFAAMINAVSLVIIAVVIFIESYERLINPEPVKTVVMLIVAGVGLVVNAVIAFSLHRLAGSNLNIKSAYLHVIGDLLASVGVIVGGLIMLFTGNYLADPIISIFVGLIILRGAYSVIKEASNILLEGAPSKIDYNKLKQDILATPGVINIHDLHVWTLSSDRILLTMHVQTDNNTLHDGREVLTDLKKMLEKKYGINHTTIQLECECYECSQGGECNTSGVGK